MKKTLLLLTALLGFLMMSCRNHVLIDYITYSYYVWVNDTDHRITLSLSDAWLIDPDQDGGKDGFENRVLAPGESHTERGFGTVSPGFGWLMTVQFDDLPAVEFSMGCDGAECNFFPEGYDHDFNPAIEWNYTPEEVKAPNGCEMCPGVRWTYTFTDEDYAAAVEYLAQIEAGETGETGEN